MIQIGSIFNALSFVWTFFLDMQKVTFRMLLTALLCLICFCCFSIQLLVKSRPSYALEIIIANFCMSGVFGLIPNVTK